MAVSAKALRYKTSDILRAVRDGRKQLIEYRGVPIAEIIPISKGTTHKFKDIGFGIWSDRKDMEDVEQWLRNQREGRFRE